MSESLDLHKLRARALLMRWSKKAPLDGCRIPTIEEIEFEGRTTKLIELGFFVTKGSWAEEPKALHSSCRTKGCIMHLEFDSQDEEDLQLVAEHRTTRSLADMFRYGRSRGWFKGGGSYAN